MTLEQLIARTSFQGVTVWKSHQGGYQANVSEDGKSWHVQMHPDPVVALKWALGEPPEQIVEDVLG